MPIQITPAVKRLIIINVCVYVFYWILWRIMPEVAFTLRQWFMLTPSLVFKHGYIWQLFSYLFIHFDFTHLLFNCLGLVFLGPLFEIKWGYRYFLQFVFLSGIGAGVCVVLAGLLWSGFNVPTIGISGALNALLMAFALSYPKQTIHFYFLIPIQSRHFVGLVVFLEILSALAGSQNSLPAHLGGLLMGYLLITGRLNPTSWFKKKYPANVRVLNRQEQDSWRYH